MKQKVQKDLLADDMNAVKSDFNMLESNMAEREQGKQNLRVFLSSFSVYGFSH